MCNNDMQHVIPSHMSSSWTPAATGFALETAQLFQVDAMKPKLNITSFSSSVREASVAFAATDVSEVTYRCTVRLFTCINTIYSFTTNVVGIRAIWSIQ